MAQDIDPFKLSSPRIFLVRMVVFLTLCALVVIVLYRQIWAAFLANPGLNALIIAVLAIGIALAFRQVIRLFPEIDWVNGFRLADPGLAVERPPVLLAPMAVLLRRSHRPHGDFLADDAGHPQFDRGPAGRGARHVALHDRPARVSRTAGHVLGPDRDRRLGRQCHQHPQAWRRRGRDLRVAQRGPRRAAQRYGHLVFVVAVRTGRLARAGIPRPADQPGAEPLLYRAGGLALHHRARSRRRRRAGGGRAASARSRAT